MITAQSKSIIEGVEEIEETFIKRRGRFIIFPTEWWEKVDTKSIANDIVIKTDRPIRNVILNGKIL